MSADNTECLSASRTRLNRKPLVVATPLSQMRRGVTSNKPLVSNMAPLRIRSGMEWNLNEDEDIRKQATTAKICDSGRKFRKGAIGKDELNKFRISSCYALLDAM